MISGFYPALIVGQIAAMQSLMYISLGASLLLLNGLAGRPATAVGLQHLLSKDAMSTAYPGGTIALAALFLNALPGSCFLCIVVERAKKCLDFTVTWCFLHVCCCTMYDGFPQSREWWGVAIANVACMSLLGEYLCMRREMREIPLFHSGR